eukprot:gnl/TRDRNA2_/TRDRNA2_177023_c1_seq8.p1 gnl/TRDRNA2_/TRDRNA2_177023_c1~~gnl/TRDRNA2_/TRDRNA2_177023_c1_seq8.p1  ORF type:complete len:784 (+),score=116.28 gnl/TRDRNA2_/TRDRNA2_177023_c1_seq8:98-2449(+)
MSTNATRLAMAEDVENLIDGINHAWIVTCSALVMLMQLGFAFLEAGMVREKNTISVMMKNLIDLIVTCISWWLLGYPVSLQGIGLSFKPMLEVPDGDEAWWLFGMLFAATAATIVSGAVAERIKITGYATSSFFIVSILYPVGVYWSWGDGWLKALDPPFHDFAGSAVVHMVGGIIAFIGAKILGPRLGYFDQGTPSNAPTFKPHNVPNVVIGTFILWFGWYGFNAGSTGEIADTKTAHTAAIAAANTTLSGSTAAILVVLLHLPSARRGFANLIGEPIQKSRVLPQFDIISSCSGALAGLVAITAGCDCTTHVGAVATGAMGTIAYEVTNWAVRLAKVDDPLQAVSVHFGAGIVGTLCVGLFHKDDGLLMGGGSALLQTQCVGILALACWTAPTSFVLFASLRGMGMLRADEAHEKQGLDVFDFGLDAYGMKQTMQAFQKGQELERVLQSAGFTIPDAIASLAALKLIIARPFSPQGGNNKIKGEVQDLLEMMTFDMSANDRYLGFLSHYKAEGGDAARILYDRMSALVAAEALLGSTGSSESSSPQRLSHNEWSSQSSRDRPTLCMPNMVEDSVVSKQDSLVPVVPMPTETTPSARMGVVTGSLSLKLGKLKDALGVVDEMTGNVIINTNLLLFLDSVELRDTGTLMSTVERCPNYFILLTRHVLSRPWVVAELCAAMRSKKNVIPIRIEWGSKNDDLHFKMPDSIDDAIHVLQLYQEQKFEACAILARNSRRFSLTRSLTRTEDQNATKNWTVWPQLIAKPNAKDPSPTQVINVKPFQEA